MSRAAPPRNSSGAGRERQTLKDPDLDAEPDDIPF
jgi:hypothetical protein